MSFTETIAAPHGPTLNVWSNGSRLFEDYVNGLGRIRRV